MRLWLVVFACALVLSGCGSSEPSPVAVGAVAGRVLSAPSCPVERPGSPCPPRPVSGAVVVARQGQHEVARTTTAAGGGFRLDLPVGTYDLVATNIGGYTSTAQTGVVILAGETRDVTLTVDSGIR